MANKNVTQAEKAQALENTIKCLEHLVANIGETTNEHHWREFVSISNELVQAFPEYKLEDSIGSFYNNKG